MHINNKTYNVYITLLSDVAPQDSENSDKWRNDIVMNQP